jgi:predicted amidohydrolase
MCNSVGFCDNFESAGQTSAWNEDGILLGQLDSKEEGALIFDTDAKSVAHVK